MNTYTYEITNLFTTDVNPERPKDVVRVLTAVTATSPTGQTKMLNCMFNMSPAESSFTAFEDLTDAQVRQWVDASDQWPFYQTELDNMLAETPAPSFVPQTLPWLPTEEQSIAEMQAMDPATSSSNTMTVTSPVMAQVSEEYIKALVYQVLEEVNGSQV